MAHWDGTPAFAAGQGMSAAAGLNYLADAERILFDRLTGYHWPTWGIRISGGGSGATHADWRIRHKQNSFYWRYQAQSGTSALYINGTLVPGSNKTTGGTLTMYSGTADITSLGLTVGQFYTVSATISGSGVMLVYNLYETVTQSYPSLAAFTDGSTPTAAQWQALSTYAEMLHTETNFPRPLVGGKMDKGIAPGVGGVMDGYFWVGGNKRQARYLYVRGKILANYNPGAGSPPNRATLSVWINNVQRAVLEGLSPITETEVYTTVDLAAISIAVGDVYYMRLSADTYDIWDDVAQVTALEVYEQPETTPSIASYTQPPTWVHGDYVKSSLTKQVLTLKNNLGYLRAAATYQNGVANKCQTSGWAETPLYGRRLHRWLHYNNTAYAKPALHHSWGGEEKTTTLKDSAGAWLSYDLGAVQGLTVGTRYWVTGADWAIEDDVL